jgi:hypothetical protein
MAPRNFSEKVMEMLRRAGADDAALYVYKRTGLLYLESTVGQLTAQEIKIAEAALKEYQGLQNSASEILH